MVVVEIENYGVPIPRDEIVTGFIYRLGTRGRLSGDRGRTGTGIGLADARSVARAHGGDFYIESRPASPAQGEKDLTKPFITRAFFSLPIESRGPAR
jgi:signal transduction histidine kinase